MANYEPKTQIEGGVRKHFSEDGHGRQAEYYTANCMIDGKRHQRKWAVAKWGDLGANLLAVRQKLQWLQKAGIDTTDSLLSEEHARLQKAYSLEE